MADVTVFEPDVAELCNAVLAIAAQIERTATQRWSAAAGANYEAMYNTPPETPAFVPEGGDISQSQMNNGIAALLAVRATILGNSANLATVAEFAPSLLDNDA